MDDPWFRQGLNMKKTLLSCIALFTGLVGFSQEQWSVYMVEMDSLFASVVVNVAADEQNLEGQKEFLVRAKVRFIADHNGFPTSESYELVNTFEQRMDDFIFRHPEAQIVGSCMHNGEREMYVYTSDTSGVRKELQGITSARFPSLKIEVGVEKDTEWSHFWDFLFPNAEQIEYINNTSVLSQLTQAGDDLSKPREVYYWFYSEDEAVSNMLKEELVAQGFNVIAGSMMDGDLPFALTMSRVDHVDIQSVTSVTVALNALAEKYNSVFDGWETTVVAE